MYGPSKADYMFEQLFGRTTANVQDTDFIYFSDYLNRIMRVDELIYTDYNNHIVSLTRIQKIEIYDKLYRKPRMARMRMLNKYNLSEGHGEKQKEESSSSKIKQDHDMENLDILNRLQRNSTDNGRGRTSSSVSINTNCNTNKNSAANQNPVPPSMATRPSRSAPSTRRPTFR